MRIPPRDWSPEPHFICRSLWLFGTVYHFLPLHIILNTGPGRRLCDKLDCDNAAWAPVQWEPPGAEFCGEHWVPSQRQLERWVCHPDFPGQRLQGSESGRGICDVRKLLVRLWPANHQPVARGQTVVRPRRDAPVHAVCRSGVNGSLLDPCSGFCQMKNP